LYASADPVKIIPEVIGRKREPRILHGQAGPDVMPRRDVLLNLAPGPDSIQWIAFPRQPN
jgi:hypothetical protein